MEQKQKKFIRLLEPHICLSCRFADIKTMHILNEDEQYVIHCKRADCDNWDYSDIQPVNFNDQITEN